MSKFNNTEDTKTANDGWIKTHSINKLTGEVTLFKAVGYIFGFFAVISTFF